MAPEQARGKAVDRRADIWAFGCVLFEMLTGRRAFDGDDVSTTLAAVLKTEPDWKMLPPAAPAALRRLLVRCLKKDPRDRLQAIGDARAEIAEMLSGVTEPMTVTPIVSAGTGWRRAAAGVMAVLLVTTATGVIVWFVARSTVARPRVSRFAFTPPSAAALSISLTRDVALTPDGSRLVYVGANGTTLFVRPLDQLDVTALVRGDGLRDPFVSPDGQWVGFFDGPNTMKKVALAGGPSVLVARLDTAERGATWAADSTIIFATQSTMTGLQRVSANGGEPDVLTQPDRAHGEANHWWPERLPGGQAVLYSVTSTTGGLDAGSIAVLDLRSGRSTIVLRGGSHAQYGPSGHLVYAAGGTLRAVRFDPTHGIVSGTPTPVVPQVRTTATGAVDAMLALDGTLVYLSGGTGSVAPRTLVWVDGQGLETPLAVPSRVYLFPRVSPDGSRIAVTAFDPRADIWLWDLVRSILTRVTFDSAVGTSVWTPDGRRVVFASNQTGVQNLYSQAADGTGAAERLTQSPNVQTPTAVSPDGTLVVFTDVSATTGQDVMGLRLDGSHQVSPLVQTRFDERNGIVSPDGRWLAYEANETGTFEIYVRPFPNVTRGHWQVSTSGGTQPLWARSGRDLFYVAPPAGALMRVAVGGGPTWTASAPTKVFEGRYVMGTGGNNNRNYDIAPDGQRFLMLKAGGSDATDAPPQIVVVQHFDEELKRLVPK
jgi:serine/threonine-protein kinase